MPPNVIVFLTDQQRWDTCGANGNPLGLTPNYDRLARRGTHVPEAFTCQPVCGPARSCLQTGRYATATGCHRNGIPLPREVDTLARCFGRHDYATAYMGKWHLGSRDPVPVAERGGYDEWLAANWLEMTSDAWSTVVYDQHEREVRLPGYRVDALVDAAIRYVDRQSREEQPFFLFLSLLEPHQQNHRDDYPAPEGYAERYGGRWMPPDLAALGGSAAAHLPGYCGMVKRIDEALGRLQDALRSLGQEENTVLCFTSDHGCHFKTRNDEYKRSVHESSLRVPLAFAGSGFSGGGEIDRLVSLIDVPPTLLAAAGLPVPEEMQGRSLLPLLRGQPADWPEEVLVQTSEVELGRAVRTKRWKYGVVAPDRDAREHADSERYVETYLFDLQADPAELVNLVGLESHRAVADRMQRRLVQRMVEAGEEAPLIVAAEPRPAGQRRVSADEVDM